MAQHTLRDKRIVTPDFNRLVQDLRAAEALVEARSVSVEVALSTLARTEQSLREAEEAVEALRSNLFAAIDETTRNPTPILVNEAQLPSEVVMEDTEEESKEPDGSTPRSDEAIETQFATPPALPEAPEPAPRKTRGLAANSLATQILTTCRAEPFRAFTNDEIARLIKVDRSRAATAIWRLCRAGHLEARGAGLCGYPKQPAVVRVSENGTTPNKSSEEPLIDDHCRHQVRATARGIARALPRAATITAEDLESIGLVALVERAREFDPSRGVPLWGYAKLRVSGAMHDELRRLDTVSRERRQAIRTGTEAVGAPPIPTLVEEEAARSVPADAAPIDEQIEKHRRLAALREAARTLPPRLYRVYRLRVEEGWGWDAIGESLGVSGPRAHQIFGEVKEALRDDLVEDERNCSVTPYTASPCTTAPHSELPPPIDLPDTDLPDTHRTAPIAPRVHGTSTAVLPTVRGTLLL